MAMNYLLQTDAGNTKIKVGDDYIKLTKDFIH